MVATPSQVQGERAVYYMPHREAVRETLLSTKVFVMSDVSSHPPGYKAVNDGWETGPHLILNPERFEVLLRFRWHRIAMKDDMENYFLL